MRAGWHRIGDSSVGESYDIRECVWSAQDGCVTRATMTVLLAPGQATRLLINVFRMRR
jgi:hypothetical protein